MVVPKVSYRASFLHVALALYHWTSFQLLLTFIEMLASDLESTHCLHFYIYNVPSAILGA